MRKILIPAVVAWAAAVVYVMSSAGVGGNSAVVIGDKLFLTQLQDMVINAKNYEGKTVRVEGFAALLAEDSPWRFAVARIYSCCGPDGYPVGLPCAYAGETPRENVWIEVEGTFHVDEKNGPYLEVVKLTVKSSSGQRLVFS